MKGASCEKAGIFASAFQRVAMLQNLPFADLAVLPAGLRRRVCRGHPFDGAAGWDEGAVNRVAIAPRFGRLQHETACRARTIACQFR